MRRHGAVGQRAVSKADLKPYIGMVRRRLELNAGKPIMAQLEARWMALKGYADGILAESRAGMAMSKHRREAAVEIVRLCQWVRPREAVETVLAIYVMQDAEPHRFVSDHGFWTQLVRRVRGLPAGRGAVLHSDSQILIKGMNEWRHSWAAKGWRTTARKPVENQDLWHRLIALSEARTVEWLWVRGHAGHRENEMVDALANEAAQQMASNIN